MQASRKLSAEENSGVQCGAPPHSSYLTVKRNVIEWDVAVQLQILSDDAVERRGDENGI